MKDFKKYTIIPAEPMMVYAALTNPATLKLWTGDDAEMSEEPGSDFSLWEGSITGKNIEFEKNKKIVQEWDFGDQEEASVVTILCHEHVQGTSLEIRHTNIPDEAYNDIKDGWENVYLAALVDFYK